MSVADARHRVAELSRTLQLEEFAHRKTKTYSGGQLRRLNVASGIVHRPEVLFLDEPTTGLDPQNRANLWVHLRELRDAGTTIFLTTHYLEEADVLSDRLAIMDNGKIVAEGTPRELKAEIAGDAIVVRPRIDELDLEGVRALLAVQSFVLDAHVEDDSVRLHVHDGAKALPQLFALLEGERVVVEAVSLSQPSLDDVFLLQTGRSLRDATQNVGV
jgi:ABC-2 type transport system ATP-binding protein